MAYYLIDFENVKSRGMEGVELLAEEDTVCIFYSDNADSMTFDLHRKLNETKAQIIYHKVAVGTKNARGHTAPEKEGAPRRRQDPRGSIRPGASDGRPTARRDGEKDSRAPPPR